MKLRSFTRLAAACLCGSHFAAAIELDTTSDASIKAAASTVAYKLMTYYTGNETGDTPGYLPDPYYWWEAGAMFGSLIDYWYYTNDTTYNDLTEQAMVHQAGDDRNYMPANASKSLGNDDQGFWGMSAMTAAETNFQNPPAGQPQWLALAQAVFASQWERWDMETCGGGLRWQIFTFNKGYDYKNSISNGAMFNLATRLAVYTGNQTYADIAEKTWDWVESVGLIGGTNEGKVFDGTSDLTNCTKIDEMQWSYNAGIFMHGAANMYKFTNSSQKWLDRATDILDATTETFFYKDTTIMYEQACEPSTTCNNDQKTFKAYLSRWLAATTRLIPSLKEPIMTLLTKSAAAAAQQCDAGHYGATCGTRWYEGKNDGIGGVGQQMCALEVIGSLLVAKTPELYTNDTGGTSKGDYAGNKGSDERLEKAGIEVTPGGTAGAAILTALFCVGVVGSVWFMLGTDGWVG